MHGLWLAILPLSTGTSRNINSTCIRNHFFSHNLIAARTNEEIVETIPDASIADWIRTRINDKYITAQEEGRV